MLYALTSAYSRKDYDNHRQGLPLETNIGKLFSIFAWGLNQVQEQANLIKLWDNIDRAQGSVLDRYGANFGVRRFSENDALYRLAIGVKVISQLSGGDTDTIIKAAAELFGVEPPDILMEDLYPAKIALHVDFARLSQERRELLIPIIYAIKRIIAAGVGMRFYLHMPPRETYTRLGGVASITVKLPIPEQPDEYDFQSKVHIGGQLSSMVTMPVPERRDELTFRSEVRAGGQLSSVATLPVPERRDELTFQSETSIGGRIEGTITCLPVVERADDLSAERAVRAGGKMALHARLPAVQYHSIEGG